MLPVDGGAPVTGGQSRVRRWATTATINIMATTATTFGVITDDFDINFRADINDRYVVRDSIMGQTYLRGRTPAAMEWLNLLVAGDERSANALRFRMQDEAQIREAAEAAEYRLAGEAEAAANM